MKVHFIAIGGSAMHNLAIALHKKGCRVTGSDDEIFDPSRSRLIIHGLLPESYGWFPDKIHSDLDAVIVGMHAKADNPELLRAKQLGLQIFSYPEYLYEQSKNKTRIVIGGSHGKTTITSMILHVLQYHQIKADYMVGAQLEGFDVMVRLTDDAPFMIMEGDEYPSSPVDLRPKFHLYRPNIAVISGIAWDHINVFRTFDTYVDQFRTFIRSIEEPGKLIYCASDPIVKKLCNDEDRDSLTLYPYHIPGYEVIDGKTHLIFDQKRFPIRLFGKHNLLNIEAARTVCLQLGIDHAEFLGAMENFKGASKRMEVIYQNQKNTVIRDFAHAPSKLKATVDAVREQFPGKKIIACMELHTYSSLSKEFLTHYQGSMDGADLAIVFYSPHALELKRLPMLQPEMVAAAFDKPGIKVITDKDVLEQIIRANIDTETIFLLMSSGNFGGLEIQVLIREISSKTKI